MKSSVSIPKLYIVIPCYNEEEVLNETTKQLEQQMNDLIKNERISNQSRVMYVNDESKDKTWELIEKFIKSINYLLGLVYLEIENIKMHYLRD